ncbi:internal alternative NAD(P)H-ubiquinone oxidoreductase A2, mitochondrial-like isoform X1 [Papaver somniferum]|uniref:internal alternative NAD(P)H-ubiquinone oxidoreductase A2, mitochondrial-like isoform X1 n=2 Tax=Papaver somniferum TaxID=3469 RepID=UPI000E6FBADD|nr:internal alternative NAD(P)H-ubiquinone oxidoreductase A2, mitochondrial-like isoform X1 [Papaver somniferum]XP_026410701.1 internal alternative NAD(P)H-ubiquinone oxidoreductase A2, mitochondrial-like isoform X1 [Papaver somniferum]
MRSVAFSLCIHRPLTIICVCVCPVRVSFNSSVTAGDKQQRVLLVSFVMAMSRFGRSNLKQSGKAIRSFMTERTTPLTEVGGSALLSPSSLQALTPCSNNTKTVSSIGQMNQMSYGLRGINTTPQHKFQQSAERIEEDSESESDDRRLPGLEATKPGEKPRVVVLGTGWASCRFLKGIDTSIYDVVCISPRNHMVFTPLLASTCVGTLEFRSVAEPISRIQSALSTAPNSHFYLANCLRIDSDSHEVYSETVSNRGLPNEHGLPKEPYRFKVAYDKLVIAAGAEPLTFNIKGVKEHAFFLREVNNAQEIRKRLLLNLMKADNPGLPVEERKRLLHCVVVGGGPTGVEFSGELSDFIIKDVHEQYSHVKDDIHVTLIEANEILSSFDVGLRATAMVRLYSKIKD